MVWIGQTKTASIQGSFHRIVSYGEASSWTWFCNFVVHLCKVLIVDQLFDLQTHQQWFIKYWSIYTSKTYLLQLWWDWSSKVFFADVFSQLKQTQTFALAHTALITCVEKKLMDIQTNTRIESWEIIAFRTNIQLWYYNANRLHTLFFIRCKSCLCWYFLWIHKKV